MVQTITMTLHFNSPGPGLFRVSGSDLGMPLRVTDGRSHYDVTARDIDILAAMEDYRTVSLEQVWAAFFSPASSLAMECLFLAGRYTTDGRLNSAYQRLVKLTRLGYIERSHRHGFPHVYRLAAPGQRLLGALRRSRFKNLAPWPAEVRHPLMVAGAGLYFSRLLGLRVIPERALLGRLWSSIREGGAGGQEPIPDLKVAAESGELRVEVELSEKRPPKYAALWRRLGDRVREEPPTVLYLVPDRGFEDRLLALARADYFPGIYAANLEDLCREGVNAAWRNFNGERFQFAGGRAEGSAGRP